LLPLCWLTASASYTLSFLRVNNYFSPYVDIRHYSVLSLHPMTTYTSEDFAKWGKAGGKKRAKNLTAERRKEIARLAGSAPKKKAKRK